MRQGATPRPAAVSDHWVQRKLDAARDARLQTLQLVRDDDVVTGSHPTAADFDAVMLDL